MTKLSLALVAVLAAVGCNGKSDAPASGSAAVPIADQGSAKPPISDKPVTDKPATDKPATDKPVTDKPATDKPTAPGELPKECGEWKAMIDKLATCDKMPEAQRKVIHDVYVEAAKTWEGFPPDNKPALAQSCKAGADAIMSSAKATCGW